MPATILEYPREWSTDVDTTFRLRSNSVFSQGLSPGAADIYGMLGQVFVASIPIGHKSRRDWQRISAFFSRLAGVSGFVRMFDPKRIRPGRDMRRLTGEPWSDATLFTDGTGWAEETALPPFVQLYAAAAAGDDSIVLTGLPVSESPCLWAGDLLELRPGGIPLPHGALHEISFDAPTDASGRTRAYIAPALREGFAVGDMVVLNTPTSVFHAVDDDQGILAHTLGGQAVAGFSLIEVISSP